MKKRRYMPMNQVVRLARSLGHAHARWWYVLGGHKIEAKARADAEERALRKLAYAIAFTVARMNQRAVERVRKERDAKQGRVPGKLTHRPFELLERVTSQ